jgi:hypothetical protein
MQLAQPPNVHTRRWFAAFPGRVDPTTIENEMSPVRPSTLFRTQARHSMHTVAQHFERSEPQVYAVYDKIVKAARACGPVGEDPKKTSIHLTRRTAFAGVATRKTALVLTLKASSDIQSDKIIKHEQASANRWHLNVKLEHPRDVDATVIGWIKQAYGLAE